ncbi:DUF3732 domain-containing protein [Pseudoxanthomonas suwonensis]|uniref:DUF3732 domain-containing protein n=1 Tax=Pseudoxanthomonas suwonensis TaxID=314722 RepID=UPI0004B52C11|nr:DUF3732 domain-containing protein [Pseudoxanthomonas suwonensis]
MSFQILDIVLYAEGQEPRVLSLRPGKLNIITGDSMTGKTALVDIVDYCLGSKSCHVSSGVIRQSVDWYALRIAQGNDRHFIARKAPARGRTTTSDAYYATGVDLEIPPYEELAVTTNIQAVMARLEEVTGIGVNLHLPPEGQTRRPLQAGIRHALAYVFQPQTEISQPTALFHGQGDTWVAQAIKDSFPYFVGAVDEDYVSKVGQLRDLRRELRKQESALATATALAEEGSVTKLVTEAKFAGLLPQDYDGGAYQKDVAALRDVAIAAIGPNILEVISASDDNGELDRLNDERSAMQLELRRLNDELRAMQGLRRDEGGYVNEAKEQVARLKSLDLLGEGESACILCGQELPERIPQVEELRSELERATQQLDAARRHTPGLERLILDKQSEADQVRARLRENWSRLEAVSNANQQLADLRLAAERRAHVTGRISMMLEAMEQAPATSELQASIENLRRIIERLEEEIGSEAITDRVEWLLSKLSRPMTRWAKDLELEHSGVPFRLDARKLTVVADALEGPIFMHDMGSGANWLGCHLIAHLALHDLFTRNERPVPRFLMLDQPSQVYFPAEAGQDVNAASDEDEDRLAVVRMFNLIRNVVEGLAPHFQVIITEHADLSEPWYQDAVVERWRNGVALIPPDWIRP